MNVKRERCVCGDLKQKRKKYCEPCQKQVIKNCKKRHMSKLRVKKVLNKFYKNLRINLIETPYLIDRRKIELSVMR